RTTRRSSTPRAPGSRWGRSAACTRTARPSRLRSGCASSRRRRSRRPERVVLDERPRNPAQLRGASCRVHCEESMTNETTPDAVEAALCKMYRIIVCDYGTLSDMTVTATLALEGFLAERARHAEEVAALHDQLRKVEG